MYRIAFDYKSGKFVVQVLTYGIVWRTVQSSEFDTYQSARNWVTGVGLDGALSEQRK